MRMLPSKMLSLFSVCFKSLMRSRMDGQKRLKKRNVWTQMIDNKGKNLRLLTKHIRLDGALSPLQKLSLCIPVKTAITETQLARAFFSLLPSLPTIQKVLFGGERTGPEAEEKSPFSKVPGYAWTGPYTFEKVLRPIQYGARRRRPEKLDLRQVHQSWAEFSEFVPYHSLYSVS